MGRRQCWASSGPIGFCFPLFVFLKGGTLETNSATRVGNWESIIVEFMLIVVGAVMFLECSGTRSICCGDRQTTLRGQVEKWKDVSKNVFSVTFSKHLFWLSVNMLSCAWCPVCVQFFLWSNLLITVLMCCQNPTCYNQLAISAVYMLCAKYFDGIQDIVISGIATTGLDFSATTLKNFCLVIWCSPSILVPKEARNLSTISRLHHIEMHQKTKTFICNSVYYSWELVQILWDDNLDEAELRYFSVTKFWGCSCDSILQESKFLETCYEADLLFCCIDEDSVYVTSFTSWNIMNSGFA